MKMLSYRIFLHKEPEGGLAVTVPSLPGCVTFGETLEEAMKMAKEAIELYIKSLRVNGDSVPTEDDVFEHTLTVDAYA